MQIVPINEENVHIAGRIYSASWKKSHRAVCTAEFVAKHTPQAQTEQLRREMEAGKEVFMLVDDEPVGIVAVGENLIEKLYVHPRKQNRGYGSRLLHYAMKKCPGAPTLWVLNTNSGAQRLYERNGFSETGKQKPLRNGIYIMEMRRDGFVAGRKAQ